jgi:hypothetical protein
MAIYSEFSHEKMWFSIVMLVYQRVACRKLESQMISPWSLHRMLGQIHSNPHKSITCQFISQMTSQMISHMISHMISYIISYHISYHISYPVSYPISYPIVPCIIYHILYHISYPTSYHILHHIISYPTSYPTSYHIISHIISYNVMSYHHCIPSRKKNTLKLKYTFLHDLQDPYPATLLQALLKFLLLLGVQGSQTTCLKGLTGGTWLDTLDTP